MKSLAKKIAEELNSLGSDKDAEFLQRFFKTAPGQYAEGDVFIGVRVPVIRKLCKGYKKVPLAEVEELLASPIHEHRFAALVLLCENYKKAASRQENKRTVNIYMKALRAGKINNWDLVDASCHKIVGPYYHNQPEMLITLASSKNLWERRTAIVSTFYSIRLGSSQPTLEVARLLLNDKQDLIHKAVGWMLREVGKKVSSSSLTDFLDKYAAIMPRTMLRYAIERLNTEQKTHYMSLKNIS